MEDSGQLHEPAALPLVKKSPPHQYPSETATL